MVIISNPDTSDEVRVEAEAQLQANSAFFEMATPVYEGNIVEFPDPRGGVQRRLAWKVNISRAPAGWGNGDGYTEVKFGAAPPVRTSPVRRLTVELFHGEVIRTAGDLFADGQYQAAVSEAFKSLELRVRKLLSSRQSGVKLMQEAFGSDTPKLDLSTHQGQSGKDEREGFLALFRGAALGIRNPLAHETLTDTDPQHAMEYLALASLLHRRIDSAEIGSRDSHHCH